MEASEHVAELREQGYTILPGVYSAEYVQRFRAELERIYEEVGRPHLVFDGDKQLAPGITLRLSGLTIRKVLHYAPSLAEGYIHPDVAEVLLAALGDEMRMEMTSCMMSDAAREMHHWHMHIGGLDEASPPPKEIVEREAIGRLTLLVYLNDIHPGAGQLLIYPRRLTDPTECPFRGLSEPWEGQVALNCPAGTAVLTDERTWHASTPREEPGFRMFFGGQFASGEMPKTRAFDESLPAFHAQIPWVRLD
ncbi:MAG: phytanoyl-CoA dioxygenase family protein [Myxococcota bacterium]